MSRSPRPVGLNRRVFDKITKRPLERILYHGKETVGKPLSWVEGAWIGHAQDVEGKTGVTALLFPGGAVGGCYVGGFATGTRDLDALRPEHPVPVAHGVMLAGGSAYGLEAARGVMDFLEAQSAGLPVGGALVPIVPAAIIFDLAFGNPSARPDRNMGYEAASNALQALPGQGSVGAGTGATVGKAFGMERAMKGGIGAACVPLENGGSIAAIACVNAFGDILDPKSGKTLAGLREASGSLSLLDTASILEDALQVRPWDPSATTLGVVLTDIPLSKVQANRIAKQVFGAIHSTHRPAITSFDGDVVFVFSTKRDIPLIPPDLLAFYAKEQLVRAIINAIVQANGFGLVPAYQDLSNTEAF